MSYRCWDDPPVHGDLHRPTTSRAPITVPSSWLFSARYCIRLGLPYCSGTSRMRQPCLVVCSLPARLSSGSPTPRDALTARLRTKTGKLCMGMCPTSAPRSFSLLCILKQNSSILLTLWVTTAPHNGSLKFGISSVIGLCYHSAFSTSCAHSTNFVFRFAEEYSTPPEPAERRINGRD